MARLKFTKFKKKPSKQGEVEIMTDDIRMKAITTYTNKLQMNRMSATLDCVLATLPKINHKFAR